MNEASSNTVSVLCNNTTDWQLGEGSGHNDRKGALPQLTLLLDFWETSGKPFGLCSKRPQQLCPNQMTLQWAVFNCIVLWKRIKHVGLQTIFTILTNTCRLSGCACVLLDNCTLYLLQNKHIHFFCRELDKNIDTLLYLSVHKATSSG